MIQNLPKIFPINRLSAFSFGDVEGKNDELLNDPVCVCKIHGIEEFLDGNKSIAVGERGVGKTALFRLISSGYFKFVDAKGQKHISLAIDEELQYQVIKAKLVNVFVTNTIRDDISCRFVWEIFLLYKTLICVRESFHGKVPNEIKSAISEYEQIFGKKKKETITDLLGAVKKTVGFKIDTSPFGNPVPNFYLSVEPPATPADLQSEDIPIINIDSQKASVNKFLLENKMVLDVLLDKLDEFVIKEDYETQKQVLQGLLFVERGYDNYSNINIKIFLRSDLFMKLDFEELGFDKVSSKVTVLYWSNEDIRTFIARRIFYNYIKLFDISKLAIAINKEKLYLDSKSIESFYKKEDSKNKFAVKLFQIETWARKMLIKLFSILHITRDQRSGKRISFVDEVNRQVITTIFPKIISHRNQRNKQENTSIFNFIDSHFTLGTGNTTPRIIVMYLEKCISLTKTYYNTNPDDVVEVDQNGEYPLIKRETVTAAYHELQELVNNTFMKISKRWENQFKLFRAKKGNKINFSYGDVKKICSMNDDLELKDFLAFLCHIGYLTCQDTTKGYQDRSYILPILFR